MADTGAPLSLTLLEVGQASKETVVNQAFQTINDAAAGGAAFTEAVQDAVGVMVDSSLVYTDATPLLSRAALTGDVTASQGGNVLTIGTAKVLYAMIQNVTDARLLGRSAGSDGPPQELTVGTGLSLSGGALTCTVSGGISDTLNRPNTGLSVLDTDASHALALVPGSNLTANRSLTLTTGDADRVVTLTGNATLNQDVSTAGSPTFAGLTLTGASGNTLVVDTTTLVVDATNHRVGIGTATPAARFTLQAPTAVAGTGTLVSTSTTVTGTGTAFLSDVAVGDLLTASGQAVYVVAIAGDTSLTTDVAFSPVLAGVSFTIQKPTAEVRDASGTLVQRWLPNGDVHLGLISATTPPQNAVIALTGLETIAGQSRKGFLFNRRATATAGATAAGLTGFQSAVNVDATNTQDWTSTLALVGAFFNTGIVSGASGTITGAVGISTAASNQSATATLTTSTALRVVNPTATGTITNAVGVAIEIGTAAHGTNNTALLLGTLTPPSGNYALYSSSTYASYLAGNLGLGTTSFGSSAAKVLALGPATAPSTSPTDVVQLYEGDRGGTAGKGSLLLRTEDGTVHCLGDRVGIGTTSPGALLDVGVAGSLAGVMRLEGATSGYVAQQVASAAGSWSFTWPNGAGSNGQMLVTDGSGVGSWVAPRNVATLTDAATVTLNIADARPYIGTLASLSQTTTFANPTGSPTDGQYIEVRIISSSAQSVSFGTKFKGSAGLALPTTTTGSNLRDRWAFEYVSSTDTYDLLASSTGVG